MSVFLTLPVDCRVCFFSLNSPLETSFGVLGLGKTKGHDKLIPIALSLIWVDLLCQNRKHMEEQLNRK